jgi:hypothetical protein
VKDVRQERKLVITPRPQDGSDPNSVLSPITFQNPNKIASKVAEMWLLKCSLSGVPYFLFLWLSVSEEKGQPWRHRYRWNVIKVKTDSVIKKSVNYINDPDQNMFFTARVIFSSPLP